MNDKGRYIPVRCGDLIRLECVWEVARRIQDLEHEIELERGKEKRKQRGKIDLLFMSARYLTFSPLGLEQRRGLVPTDAVTMIRFQSRMLLVLSLMPLLLNALSPRVVTVLAGGREGGVPFRVLPPEAPFASLSPTTNNTTSTTQTT